MKKALIPALLLVSAAFTPCVRSTVELPGQNSGIVSVLASPLFWHLWDEILDRQLSHWTGDVSAHAEDTEWSRATLASLFFQVLLNRAIDGFQSVEHKNDCAIVSISHYIIRRTIERPFARVHEHPAEHRRSKQYATKERS